ncbi:MAG: heterodisulfide reductase [Euryarchaeota archaeon]|nr:heterodisulfide reductase [Euryarchaeota archaeon]
MKFAYLPGCTTKGSSREVQDAMLCVADGLGITLVDMPSAACCGGGIIKQANHRLQLTINARNFAMAEKLGLDILTLSASCQGVLHEDLTLLLTDEPLRAEINDILERTSGIRFEGELRVRHILEVLVEDIGLDSISAKVKNPIGFQVAAYYGSSMLRSGANGLDDPFNPSYFEKLIEALGGIPVNYDGRTRSIGSSLGLLAQEKTVMKMVASVLSEAKQEGARLMVSACPKAHFSLDVYQPKAARISGKKINMPVIHLPELVAFSLGYFVNRYAQLRTRIMVIGD